jgi:hypothetical protein
MTSQVEDLQAQSSHEISMILLLSLVLDNDKQALSYNNISDAQEWILAAQQACS